ncbi:MAG TPA: hypothetical protein EYP57_08480, partial [Thermodesulfobacteriaceae bacterium]|nr:hypothetical protein [Thermodesulfobacteriaceae bacterium]
MCLNISCHHVHNGSSEAVAAVGIVPEQVKTCTRRRKENRITRFCHGGGGEYRPDHYRPAVTGALYPDYRYNVPQFPLQCRGFPADGHQPAHLPVFLQVPSAQFFAQREIRFAFSQPAGNQDQGLAKLLEALEPRLVILMSDHGMGPVLLLVVLLATYLLRQVLASKERQFQAQYL